jgi:hypothetical protein
MFYHTATNTYINEGSAFEIDGVQYPQNWLHLTSLQEKALLGIVEVSVASYPADDRFYWVNSVLENGTLTYTNTPKDLASLKTQWKNTIRQQAHSILLPTDYMEIRNMKDATYKPEWMVWRESVRDAASNTLAAIDLAENVSALQAVVQVAWPNNPDYVVPQ